MDKVIEHETHIEAAGTAEAAEAVAYLWVCACGDGDELLTREIALLDSRRHERLAG